MYRATSDTNVENVEYGPETPTTAVREVAGSIPAEDMFSENNYPRLELSNVQIHGYQESPKG